MSDQYTNSKVQAKDFISGWAVAFIITGTGVSLPVLYLGAEVSLQAGTMRSLWAFGLSTLVLTVMCTVTTIIGNRSRLSTYMILRFPFGEQGAKILNFIIGVSLLGWFSVALELLAQAILDTSMETFGVRFPLWTVVVVTSVFITVTTIYGIKSIEKLANWAVPILLVFLLFVVYQSFQQPVISTSVWDYVPAKDRMSLFDATSALVGSSILLPILMADFSRFIYNDRQSLIAVLGVTVGFPLVLIISLITAVNANDVDIIQIMKSVNLVLPAFVVLFVSTWVTNATNLYSISLTFSTISTTLGFRRMCIVSSIAGTILALFGFSEYLFGFLEILGVFTPAIAAIYVIDFFFVKQQQYDLDQIPAWNFKGLIAWVVASMITLLTYLEFFQLTHAYFIDSFLIAGVVYGLLCWRGKQ